MSEVLLPKVKHIIETIEEVYLISVDKGQVSPLYSWGHSYGSWYKCDPLTQMRLYLLPLWEFKGWQHLLEGREEAPHQQCWRKRLLNSRNLPYAPPATNIQSITGVHHAQPRWLPQVRSRSKMILYESLSCTAKQLQRLFGLLGPSQEVWKNFHLVDLLGAYFLFIDGTPIATSTPVKQVLVWIDTNSRAIIRP